MKKLTLAVLFFAASLLFAQGQLPTDGLVGRWDFDDAGDLLKSTVGEELQADNNGGGTAEYTAVSGYTAGDGAIKVEIGSFLRAFPNLDPNGEGSPERVNQYTIVIDFKREINGAWHAFHATDNDGEPTVNDWESFLRPSGTLGVGSTGYSFDTVAIDVWNRMVIVADLGNYYRYYIDGQIMQDGGEQTFDGRFSISSIDNANQLLFLGDNDGEDAPSPTSMIALYNRPLSKQEIIELGGFGNVKKFGPAIANWRFDNPSNPLEASYGNDLVLVGSHEYIQGPGIGDGAVRIGVGSHYEAMLDQVGNGGGVKVNEWSMVMDLRIPANGKWNALFQTDPSNTSDGDFFIRPEGYLGVGDLGYANDTVFTAGLWYRLALTVDAANNHFAYYLDGDSVYETSLTDFLDGRFSFESLSGENKLLLFADEDGEDNTIDVAAISIFNRKLSTEDVLGLGGYIKDISTENTAAKQAIFFDGSDNNKYASIPHHPDFDFGDSQSFTVELWVQPNIGYESDPSLIANKDWDSGSNTGWVISTRANDSDWKININGLDATGNKASRFDMNGPDISDEQWHHIAMIINRQDSTCILITDTLVSVPVRMSDIGNINIDAPINIAQDGTGNYPAKFPGAVDEVKIWRAALTPETLMEWRHKKVSDSHPHYNDLVLYLDFDVQNELIIPDMSGKGHDATLVNGPIRKVSYAPIAVGTVGDLQDLKAIWKSVKEANSGGCIISSNFENPTSVVKSDYNGYGSIMYREEKYVAVGHDGGIDASANDIGSGIVARLQRQWQWYATQTFLNTSTIDIAFDLNEINGVTPGDAAGYKLLGFNGVAFQDLGASATVDGNIIYFAGGPAETQYGMITLGTTNNTTSPLGNVTTSVNDETLPQSYELSNAYPNPFNPSTTIKFALPFDSKVNITVFDILGQEVANLVNGQLEAGFHVVNFNASNNLTSGMYIFRMNAQSAEGKEFVSTKKMMLVK